MILRPKWVEKSSIKFDGISTGYGYGQVGGGLSNAPLTIMALCRPSGVGENNQGYIFSRVPAGSSAGLRLYTSDGTGTGRIAFGLNSTTLSAPLRVTSDNFVVANSWNWICATSAGGLLASNLEVYSSNPTTGGSFRKESTYVTSTDGTGTLDNDIFENVVVGNRGSSPGDRTFNGDIAFVAKWNRVLSKEEMEAVRRRGILSVARGSLSFLWVAGTEILLNKPAVAAATVMGTRGQQVPDGFVIRDSIYIPVRTISSTSPMLGQSTTAFVPSAIPTTYNLRGSSGVAFSPVALGSTRVPIFGSQTIAFSPFATPSGGAPNLSGSSTAAFSPQALISGKGNALGSTTLTTTPQATLYGIGSGGMTASTALTIGGGGEKILTGAVGISGRADILSGNSANLLPLGGGAMQGSTSLSITPNVSIRGTGTAPLRGSAALQFVPKFHTIICYWSATSGLAFTTGARLIGTTSNFRASTTLRFTPTATGYLSSGSALIGSTTLSFQPTALGVGHRLRGTSQVAFSPLAGITGVLPGQLMGTATIALSPQANITLTAYTSGSAGLQFQPSGRAMNWTPSFITASGPMVFTPIGLPQATGDLAGLSIIRNIFSSRGGTLRGQSFILGSTALQTIPVATMEGAGGLAGTAGILADATAFLWKQTDIGGDASINLTHAAQMSGDGALDGSANQVFDTSLNAGITSSGMLSGSADILFSGGLAPAADGQLFGSATITSYAAGTYLVTTDIQGRSQMSWSGGGLMGGEGAIFGSSLSSFIASSRPDTWVDAYGQTDVLFDAVGQMVGSLDLSGAADVSITGSANLLAVEIFPLVGGTTISFSVQADGSMDGVLRGTSLFNFAAVFEPDFSNIPVDTKQESESFIFTSGQVETFIFLSESSRFSVFEGGSRGFSTARIDG